jgi:brefeldin A-resistance guanine nucleotide exchange factor 1
MMLETFRLPGEAPLIATIVESFSAKYCSGDASKDVANKDAVFILTYAIILLNTDQHNPNVKSMKRMTFEDFSRNLRGQNNGENFAPEYLKEIYESIKTNEIILPDEHDNKHAFDYAWRELLIKTETAGPLVVCDTNIYDADMFATTWKPIVSTLSYVFMSATDDAVFARIVTGFDECARIAAKYGNTEALDQIVYCLSRMTTLDTDQPFNTSLNTEVQAGDSSVMVSELAVKLGRNFRAQLATLVLFRVVTGNEAQINKSWKHVCDSLTSTAEYSADMRMCLGNSDLAQSFCQLIDSFLLSLSFGNRTCADHTSAEPFTSYRPGSKDNRYWFFLRFYLLHLKLCSR